MDRHTLIAFFTEVTGRGPVYGEMMIRLMLACILGGLIGYERENVHRPAGFRTHILVCVSAALVMVTGEFVHTQYATSGVDPTRLGAQVISGIGFLCAGTIIRDGFTVKGLTTATSLWTVSCIGLTVGAGYYEGAIMATLLLGFTLTLLKRFEKRFGKTAGQVIFSVEVEDEAGAFGKVSAMFTSAGVEVRHFELMKEEGTGSVVFKITTRMKEHQKMALLSEFQSLSGIKKVIAE